MSRIISKERSLLTRYLASIGCNKAVTWQIVMLDLEEEAAICEMLQFIKENHPNISEAKLLEMSSKISFKYNSPN